MNTMTYKGYLGSVSYSDKDQVFYGKIEGINGLVNFEGESVKELTAAFHEAVDDYLAYCEDEGITPDKSYTGALNVRLTPSIHRQIAMLASMPTSRRLWRKRWRLLWQYSKILTYKYLNSLQFFWNLQGFIVSLRS